MTIKNVIQIHYETINNSLSSYTLLQTASALELNSLRYLLMGFNVII